MTVIPVLCFLLGGFPISLPPIIQPHVSRTPRSPLTSLILTKTWLSSLPFWYPCFTLPQLWNLLGPVGSLHSSIICWNMSLLFAQHLLRSLQGVAAFCPTLLHSLFSFFVLPPLDCSPSLFSKTVLTLGRSDCHITPAALLQSPYEWFTCLQRFLLLQYCI